MIPGISRQAARLEFQVDATPLIDVTFLLLIYFLVTLRMRADESRIETALPPEGGAAAAERLLEDAKEMVVYLRQEESREGRPARERRTRILLGGTGPGSETTPERIAEAARAFRAVAPDVRAVIDASGAVPHDQVVRVLDALTSAGLTRVSLRGVRPGLRVFSDPDWWRVFEASAAGDGRG